MPATFQWHHDYEVDQGTIDEEHKQLLNLANQVFRFTDPKAQIDEFTETVKRLYKYMEFHFQNEEQLMRETDYPEYEQHADSHKQFIGNMNELLKTHDDLEELLMELRKVIADWSVRHVMHEDAKIAEHARKRSEETEMRPTA